MSSNPHGDRNEERDEMRDSLRRIEGAVGGRTPWSDMPKPARSFSYVLLLVVMLVALAGILISFLR